MSGTGHGVPEAPEQPQSTEPDGPRTAAEVAKDIGLFFAGPFITMAHLASFPLIALSLLKQARRDRHTAG